MAVRLFNRGHALISNDISQKIIDTHGLYYDVLLVHISSLVQLQYADKLFLLAHRMVDDQPDSEMSWYAVALYYFVVKNRPAAKSFMHKATTMNASFGEGWLAFGHILAADGENEQAMNCYLRAARVLESHFEPLMYIGMGHIFTQNMRLAKDFLLEAASIAPDAALVVYEIGALAYQKKEYNEAYELFSRALRLALLIPQEEDGNGQDTVELLDNHIDVFYEPLICSLGHVMRRLGGHAHAIRFHQKSLLMVPNKVSSMVSIGLCYASMRKYSDATVYFHKALAIKPFHAMARAAHERMTAEVADEVQRACAREPVQRFLNVSELGSALKEATEERSKNRQKRILEHGQCGVEARAQSIEYMSDVPMEMPRL